VAVHAHELPVLQLACLARQFAAWIVKAQVQPRRIRSARAIEEARPGFVQFDLAVIGAKGRGQMAAVPAAP
jgi:hypothetical protein